MSDQKTGPILCQSKIEQVVVHARGALVTRLVTSPVDVDAGDFDLDIAGITPVAEPTSARANLGGANRIVSAVAMSLVVPRSGSLVGPSVSKLRTIQRDIAVLEAEHSALRTVREKLREVAPKPSIRAGLTGVEIAERVRVAKELTAQLDINETKIDERIEALIAEILVLRRTERAIKVELESLGAARAGEGHPTYSIRLRVGGSGPVESVRVTYLVAPARWWPLYTLRLSDSARKAEWFIEALVTQCSAEDWTGVKLEVSTSDLVRDTRLPELPTLRFGRAQPPSNRGYRKPPDGLDKLFAGANAFLASAPQTESTRRTLEEAQKREEDHRLELIRQAEVERARYEYQRLSQEHEQRREAPAPGRGAAVTRAGMVMPRSESVPMMAPQAKSSGSMIGGIIAAPFAAGAAVIDALSSADADEEYYPPNANLGDPGVAQLGDWRDFDSLVLAAAETADPASRGRLTRRSRNAPIERLCQELQAQIEAIAPSQPVVDPLSSRGQFDHRYQASGLVDVPANISVHRLALTSASASPSTRWTTLPLMTAEVFREVEISNPFDVPLLGGPVDVYVDGTLLVTTPLSTVDRGGTARLGLGVEERIRVARNVRVEEGTAGLLGGTTEVVHHVAIEISSALGYNAKLVVFDRVPVSDEKNLEVKLLEATPQPDKYDQSDRLVPVRGGLRWRVEVAAGGKTTISFRYRLSFSSKNELVGGNRRS